MMSGEDVLWGLEIWSTGTQVMIDLVRLSTLVRVGGT